MSALDKIRSFAEGRSRDSVPIRDGLTYADARELLCEVNAARADVADVRQQLNVQFDVAVRADAEVERLRRVVAELRRTVEALAPFVLPEVRRGPASDEWLSAASKCALVLPEGELKQDFIRLMAVGGRYYARGRLAGEVDDE